MSKRTVELSIQLTNAKSVGDLEKVIKDINTELKSVDVNSEAFNQLSTQAKKADGSLKNIKEDLRGISDEKQLDSVAKLGGSLAAGLSVATIAASKFGEQSKESITKAIQTAQELSVVVGAIKPILEGLSSTNRKAFSSFVDGFKQSSIGATLFGNSTKAAIAATGLGIFIILLGTLIANWEEVSKAVKDFANSIPILQPVIAFIDNLVAKVGSLSNLFNGIKAFIVGAFTSGKSAVDEFNKALEKGNAIAAVEKQLALVKEQTVERERQIKILEAQGKKESEITALKKKSIEDELSTLQELQKIGAEISKEQKTRIGDLQTELEIIKVKAEQERFNQFVIANERAKKALELRDLEKAIEDEDAQRKIDKNKLLLDKLLANYKEEKQEELKEDLNIELEKEETIVALSASRQQAILDANNKIKAELNKKYLNQVRDQEIEYLQSIKDRTVEQETVLSDLKTAKFKETVDKITPYIQLASDSIGQITQAFTENLNQQIQGLGLEINAITQQIQDSFNERTGLEVQLQDAQGSRRDLLLAGIDAERAKEKKLAEERKKLQNEQIRAQNKANEINYANNIIQATIATAQAVLAAMSAPAGSGLVLAVITAALAAIQTGIVISNAPKPIPTFASGGYTTGLGYTDSTGHQVAGVVHDSEYVVPKRVLQSDQGSSLVNSLEAMRLGLPSFDSGGFTSSNNNGNGFSIDTLRSVIESSKIYVAVNEINDVQTNVSVIESRASI